MKIIKKKISELYPAAYNPRKDLQPDDPEYQRLKKSIIEFDYVDPVIWNKRSDRVVSGHQRLKILKELGREVIEVSVVDLPEEKEKALNVVMNNPAGSWDDEKLEDVLRELEMADIDMELTGFDFEELEKINKDNDELLLGDISYVDNEKGRFSVTFPIAKRDEVMAELKAISLKIEGLAIYE